MIVICAVKSYKKEHPGLSRMPIMLEVPPGFGPGNEGFADL